MRVQPADLPPNAQPMSHGGWQAPPPPKGNAGRIIFEVILLVLGGLGLLVFVVLIGTIFGGSATIAGTVLSLVPLAMVVAVVAWIDRWEPEPRLLLVAAFVWGGGVATLVSSRLNRPVGTGINDLLGSPVTLEAAPAVFGAPFVEEFFKGLGVLLIFLVRRHHFNGPVDGIVYACVVAGAFAFVEDIQYLAGSDEDMGAVFVLRSLMSPFGHLIYTSCVGLALGLAARSRNSLAWLWYLPLGYAAAATLHMAWNGGADSIDSYASLLGHFALWNWLPSLLFSLLIVWLRRKEVAVITARLSEYVSAGWLAPHEVAMLGSLRARRQARSWAAKGGPAARKAMKHFQVSATNLAYARHDLISGHGGIRRRGDETTLLNEICKDRQVIRGALGVA
ncbi:MAG: PrsW family intramembrane metalloprotease [Arachnia sp.]